MLLFKPEVRIRYFDVGFSLIFEEACLWSAFMGVGVEVNCIDERMLSDKTVHGLSLAVDLDTVGDRAADLESLYQWMRRRIPDGFDVIFEGDHVHIERDPRRAVHRIPAAPAK